jgi:antiphage defense system Thoeris ThsB-like protein
MARRVFFSFHYQDVIDFRANVVRQHWLTKPDREAAGFFDASIWSNAKLAGDIGIKRVINAGLNGTTATCVLIGSSTYARRWVRYEIMKSLRRGNSLFAVHINSIRGRDQRTKPRGLNPLSQLGVTYSGSGLTATLWEIVEGEWREYFEIDGSASYLVSAVGPQHRGKGYNLADWYQEYDWMADDGYHNFSSWVGK